MLQPYFLTAVVLPDSCSEGTLVVDIPRRHTPRKSDSINGAKLWVRDFHGTEYGYSSPKGWHSTLADWRRFLVVYVARRLRAQLVSLIRRSHLEKETSP